MKILFNKLKKCSKPLKVFFVICLLLYLGSLGYLTFSLLNLQGIETVIRIIALIFFFFFLFGYLIGGLITLITKRKKMFIVLSIITILLSGSFVFISYNIDKLYNHVDSISKKNITYTSNLIALSETKESDIKKIGIISDKNDVEGYILAQEIIKKENIPDKYLIEYDDYYEMLSDLYNKELDALFITSNYSVLYSSEELFSNIAYEVKVIYEFSQEMENQDKETLNESDGKKLTEPFTVLILGVDSEKDGLNANQAFNGDTLMLITFNPNTLNATMFSIPRDTYVPIACRGKAENKINSSAASGTKCVINTIEDLTDVDIDYYVKVNFKGVVDLVDAVGGVDVDVPVDFCEQNSDRLFGSHEICLKKGYQHLDGEEALAFSRHRKTLPRGDFQRIEHQQMVVEALAQKAKSIKSVNAFNQILNAISKNIDTNMETNQMLSFYSVLKKLMLDANNKITIDKATLTGNDLMVYNTSTKMNMYTFQYNRSSLKEIVNLMKVNLELKEPELIKTFSFSAKEEYTPSVAGANVKDEANTLELLPSFVGQTLSYAQSWATKHNINLSINYVTSESKSYDETLPNGYIVTQSVAVKTPISSVKSLTLGVIKHEEKTTVSSSTEQSKETKEDDDKTENKEKDEDITENVPGLEFGTGKANSSSTEESINKNSSSN